MLPDQVVRTPDRGTARLDHMHLSAGSEHREPPEQRRRLVTEAEIDRGSVLHREGTDEGQPLRVTRRSRGCSGRCVHPAPHPDDLARAQPSADVDFVDGTGEDHGRQLDGHLTRTASGSRRLAPVGRSPVRGSAFCPVHRPSLRPGAAWAPPPPPICGYPTARASRSGPRASPRARTPVTIVLDGRLALRGRVFSTRCWLSGSTSPRNPRPRCSGRGGMDGWVGRDWRGCAARSVVPAPGGDGDHRPRADPAREGRAGSGAGNRTGGCRGRRRVRTARRA